MTTEIRVDEAGDGKRLDIFIAESLGCARSAAERLISWGRVTCSEGAGQVSKSRRVVPGESYRVDIPAPERTDVAPENIPLDIVYEDECVVVVNKPRGMVVHPAPGHPGGTLVNALLWHCGDSLSGIGGKLRPGIVHRIDRDTSGLIVIAKNDLSHLSLAAQLKSHEMARVYEAVVHGSIRDERGTVDAPVGRHPTDRKRQAVTTKGARSAITHYEIIARCERHTYLRCRLETGRTHQIRVHMAHIGHPVVGDLVYGRRKPELGISGQCLHARELAFKHPITGEAVSLCTDVPEYFRDVLKRAGYVGAGEI
jgi:23S rRNA pseudouridine1911/1915/1917 synthase